MVRMITGGRRRCAVLVFAFAGLGFLAGCSGSSTATLEPPLDRSDASAGAADPTVAPTVTVPPFDDEFLAEQIGQVKVADDGGSVMVVVIEPDGTTTHASAGVGPSGTAPTAADTFRIGSITKVFTSIVTLTLVDEGLVDLDAPAANYVTRVDVPAEVSVRDLLQHTSGIPNFTNDPTFYNRMVDDPSRAFAPEETFDLVAGKDLGFEPGSRFEYSNSNFLVLGLLIEEVTGRPAAEVVRARILDPLDMTDSYLSGFEPGPAPFGSFTELYGSKQPIDFDYASIESDAWLAGAMVSSAGDLHTLFTALVGGELISAESFAEMTANDDYGLGLITNGTGIDDTLIGHNGGIIGYFTLALHSPDTGRTAFWVAAGEGISYGPAVREVALRLAG